MARRPYLLTPPQPITVEIRMLDAVPWSAGQVAQKLLVVDASVEMTVPGHEPEA